MNNVELRQLRYFASVAETSSFRKAAKTLNMSQPPLSRQIHALEASLGVSLFHRCHDGVSLTCAGVVFLAEARQILERLPYARDLAKSADRRDAGGINVGCCPYFDAVLGRFLSTSSPGTADLGWKFHSFPSASIAMLLRGGNLDAGIVRFPLPDTDQLSFEFLCREPLLAMVSSAHPLAARRELSLGDLVNQRVAIARPQPAAPVQDQIFDICRQAGLNVKYLGTEENADSVTFAVRMDNTVALLPYAVRFAWTNLRGVRLIPIDQCHASIGVGILYRRDETSPALTRCLAALRQFPMDFSIENGENVSVVGSAY